MSIIDYKKGVTFLESSLSPPSPVLASPLSLSLCPWSYLFLTFYMGSSQCYASCMLTSLAYHILWQQWVDMHAVNNVNVLTDNSFSEDLITTTAIIKKVSETCLINDEHGSSITCIWYIWGYFSNVVDPCTVALLSSSHY